MARVIKVPTNTPPFGKTPLKHGAKVEVVSLCSSKKVLMDATGAMRANMTSNDYSSGNRFVVSQIGAAVMLQCALTGHIIGANAGYLYGFRASEQQAALRPYYHEDSGAIEFEACADPGKFLAFDRRGNIIPLNGNTTGLTRQFAVRIVEQQAAPEQPKSSLSGLLNMGKKVAMKAFGEGETQLNFEKNNLRGTMLNGARVRLRSKTTGRYVAVMSNGIVHGNGDQSDVLIVHHCFGLMRYAFQSQKFPRLWLCVTLDNITWAMTNTLTSTQNKENPSMVWEVDKCKSDGTILLRRNTQMSNGIVHQYLGFTPTGKPTPTLIFPEEMGDIIVEKDSAPLHALQNPAVPIQGAAPPPQQEAPPPSYGAPPQANAPPNIAASTAPAALNYGASSAPPGGALYAMPPGALLYDGSVLLMKNKLGYLCVSGGKLQTAPSQSKDCDWKVTAVGCMVFKFENAKNGGFMKVKGSNVELGPDDNDTNFHVRFNPDGSVSFQSTVNESVFLGIKDPEIFLEMS